MTSIGYLGNVVDVWERLAAIQEASGELLVDLGSDQTSCHNPYGGGYCPVQLSYQQTEEVRTGVSLAAFDGRGKAYGPKKRN